MTITKIPYALNALIRKQILACTAIILLVCVFSPNKGVAQYTEYEIKACLCFNFAKYVKWPEEAFKNGENKLTLAIYGSDPFGDIIDNVMRGRKIRGRFYIDVKRAYSLRDLQGAHIIFISRSETLHTRKILSYVRKHNNSRVLTIGDNIDNFCKQGGIINLLDDYQFELNAYESERSMLIVASQLYDIAKKVFRETDK